MEIDNTAHPDQTGTRNPQPADTPGRTDAPRRTDAPGRTDAPRRTDAPGRTDAPRRTDAPGRADVQGDSGESDNGKGDTARSDNGRGDGGELVHRGTERGITTLTLDSPHNRNALSSRLVRELYAELESAARDSGARAVLLTHTGGTFCAGADLSEAGGPEAAATDAPLELARLLRTLVEFPKPVVARVTGHVRAGGTGLLSACDISVAGPGSTFAFTEARIGVAPAVISMPVLPRVDPRAAARYYLTGERFGPEEAARMGLITLAASPSNLPNPSSPSNPSSSPNPSSSSDPTALADPAAPADPADPVDVALAPVLDGLRRGSPQGLAESKALVSAEVLRSFDRDTGTLAALSARLFASEEAREGMTAFLERREPGWVC